MLTWQGLQTHVVHDLVVAALQEAGVDGCKGDHALARQACCERHRMLYTCTYSARSKQTKS